jgi:hypothetical protein
VSAGCPISPTSARTAAGLGLQQAAIRTAIEDLRAAREAGVEIP